MVKKYYKKIKELGISKLLLILLAGVLLAMSWTWDSAEPEKNIKNSVSYDTDSISSDKLADSIENILGKIDGITEVSVLVTYDDSGERKVLSSQNTEYNILQEEDYQGGVRKEESSKISNEYVYSGDIPYVVTETKPSVCGVLVVYKGNQSLAKDITEAVKVLTGADYNRIKVLSVD